MADPVQIVCTNCGAKYKLPDGFKRDAAKCTACGTSIDVASQRAGAGASERSSSAAAKPASAKPATAKPVTARDRSHDQSRADHRPTASRPGARRSRRGQSDDSSANQDDGSESGRSRRPRAHRKQGRGVMIGSAIGVVAVVIVAVVFLLQGDDDPNTTNVVKAGVEDSGKTAPEPKAAEAPKPASVDPALPVADSGLQETADEVAEAAAGKSAPAPAPKKPEPKPKEITSPDQVFNPMKELQPLDWPEYVTEEERAHIQDLLNEVKEGGLAGKRARDELEKLGHKGLVGIINTLREFNYLDSTESMSAYELNRMLERMTKGLNIGFRVVNIGEEVPLETAQWNAKTVEVWQGLPRRYRTPQEWDEFLASRPKAGESDK
jgi:hypothetical protein